MPMFLVGSVILAAALVVWFLVPRKPLFKSLDSPDALAQALEYLRDRGLEGGELRIQAKRDTRMSVIVTKHIIEPGKIELRGAVSDEAMHEGGYAAVHTALAARGIVCAKTDVSGRRTLELYVQDSISELDVFVQTAMQVGFGRVLTSDCVAYFKNVLIWNMPQVTGVAQTR